MVRRFRDEDELWKGADYLATPEAVYHCLRGELEQNEPPYAARALGEVVQARGGYANLSQETGLSVEALQAAVMNEDVVDRQTLSAIIEAFRPAGQAMGTEAKVA